MVLRYPQVAEPFVDTLRSQAYGLGTEAFPEPRASLHQDTLRRAAEDART